MMREVRTDADRRRTAAAVVAHASSAFAAAADCCWSRVVVVVAVVIRGIERECGEERHFWLGIFSFPFVCVPGHFPPAQKDWPCLDDG